MSDETPRLRLTIEVLVFDDALFRLFRDEAALGWDLEQGVKNGEIEVDFIGGTEVI